MYLIAVITVRSLVFTVKVPLFIIQSLCIVNICNNNTQKYCIYTELLKSKQEGQQSSKYFKLLHFNSSILTPK